MVDLNCLPTFAYQKQRGTRSRVSRQTKVSKATCRYQGRITNPRHISRSIIERDPWRESRRPRRWPRTLNWPRDIFKGLMYDMAPRPSSRNTPTPPSLLRSFPHCSSPECPRPKSRSLDPSNLCTCTTSSWDDRLTLTWYTTHISLQLRDPKVGISTIALSPFPARTVLGEYVGYVVPPDSVPGSSASDYVFDVMQGEGTLLACIDGTQVGSWTRFINHSCRPSVDFVWKRVGRETRVCAVTLRKVVVGQEITLDYGNEYWEQRRNRGLFCKCGEDNCRFREAEADA